VEDLVNILLERCAGLDVHKKSVVACRLTRTPDGREEKAVRSFGTMTADLLLLGDWLRAVGVTHVAMESTGVYTPPPMVRIWGGIADFFREQNGTDAKDNPKM